MTDEPKFTDADLKLLSLAAGSPGTGIRLTARQWGALLARLKWAELACIDADIISNNGGITFGSLNASLRRNLEKWKEVAGK